MARHLVDDGLGSVQCGGRTVWSAKVYAGSAEQRGDDLLVGGFSLAIGLRFTPSDHFEAEVMTEQSSGGEVQRFIGLILAIVGGLWIVLSGLCSVDGRGRWGRPSEQAAGWAFFALIISAGGGRLRHLCVGRGLRRKT
jgi:hypothetical protein